jgi:hypothetical protein
VFISSSRAAFARGRIEERNKNTFERYANPSFFPKSLVNTGALFDSREKKNIPRVKRD